MKKVLSLLLVLGLCFALTACKKETPAAENKKTKTLRITEVVTYDANGEEISCRSVIFNSKGLPETINKDANQYSFFYDQSGNLSYYEITSTEQTGYKSVVRFDHYGSFIEQTTHLSDGITNQVTYEYTYNDKGAPTTCIEFFNETKNSYTEYTYHDNGKVKTEIGCYYNSGNAELYAAGEAPTYEAGEIVSSYEIEYDTRGNIVKRTNSDSNSTTCDEYTYDQSGNILKELSYILRSTGKKTDFSSTEYTYDQSGKLLKECRFTGEELRNTVEYSYDEAGRLIKESNGGSYTKEYTYDQQGKLTSSVEHTGNIKYEELYDEFGRTISRATYSDEGELQDKTEYTYHEIEVTDVQAKAFTNGFFHDYRDPIFTLVEE